MADFCEHGCYWDCEHGLVPLPQMLAAQQRTTSQSMEVRVIPQSVRESFDRDRTEYYGRIDYGRPR